VGPFDQLRGHLGRRADQLGDHGDRNRGREGGNQIRLSGLLETIDQSMRQRRDARRQTLDLARNERAIDQGA
jgi:hypothetical protein